MMSSAAVAVGWFRDPFDRHEDRYFSEGRPTGLVRDGRRESSDPPPDLPLAGPPVPSSSHRDPSSTAADLRRADDAERESAYDSRLACETATSFMIRFGAVR
jgi:hypothetical protein